MASGSPTLALKAAIVAALLATLALPSLGRCRPALEPPAPAPAPAKVSCGEYCRNYCPMNSTCQTTVRLQCAPLCRGDGQVGCNGCWSMGMNDCLNACVKDCEAKCAGG
ncbi:hypothetical protein VPH35_079479 [Triticum aestivum]